MRKVCLSALKVFSGFAGLLFGFLVYKAGKIYHLRRRYRHIPGPETKGFEFKNIFI
jgi:hypothetical protein